MSKVKAKFYLSIYAVTSDPSSSMSNMKINKRELLLQKYQIDGSELKLVATISPREFGTSTDQALDYESILEASADLDQQSIYRVRVKITSDINSVESKPFYIDTSDNNKYYMLSSYVSLEGMGIGDDRSGTKIELAPAAGIEIPKWTDGVKTDVNDTGFSEEGLTAAELKDYYEDRLDVGNGGDEATMKIEAFTEFDGIFNFKRLPPGVYTMTISKTGYVSQTVSITISKNWLGGTHGTWILAKE